MAQRILVPEVVQTSAMDCGPAALKSLLEGFGIFASYARLREACQTDVDGTSIDTLEDIAIKLGLDAEQVMVPVDHVLMDETDALPAVVVVRLSTGFPHFVVVWRTAGGRVQVMDPASGRRWPLRERLLGELYVHAAAVPAAVWERHARSREFTGPLLRRMRSLGVPASASLLDRALADPSWLGIATLDAAVRLVTSVVRGRGLGRGQDAGRLLLRLYDEVRLRGRREVIPAAYWSAFERGDTEAGGVPLVTAKGAVLLRVHGRRAQGRIAADVSLPTGLAAALDEPRVHPLRRLWTTLRPDGAVVVAWIAAGLVLAAAGTALEAILLRGLFDLGRHLGVVDQRVGALAALCAFMAVTTLLEVPLAVATLRMGRRLEGRFRIALLRAIPRLDDRYLRSRPVSDLAERMHGVHALRAVPALGGQIIRTVATLVMTTAGIAWLDLASLPWAAVAASSAVAVPMMLQRRLGESDLKVRNFAGGLSQYYLDALLGLISARAHGAHAAIRRAHEVLLVDWARASNSRDRLAIGAEGLQSFVGLTLSTALFVSYFARVGEPGAAVLLLYWTMSLPVHGHNLALLLRQAPGYRNIAARLLEPLDAAAAAVPDATSHRALDGSSPRTGGVEVRFEGVSVQVGGRNIVEDVELAVEPGSHVAVVGASGAGKSSLVGLLLGWHRASAGRVLVDGVELTIEAQESLRHTTAWVDPSVQIWNRPLLDNVLYGAPDGAETDLNEAITAADLRAVLEGLPEGLATRLGEGGGLVSGGEGQRLRLARATLRRDARLVILDEAFRGLDRGRRGELLARARRWWSDATLFCVTHDIGDTMGFARVIVVHDGRVVEDGPPHELCARPGSRYARLLAAEHQVRSEMWASTIWRRLTLARGRLTERTDR